MQITISLDTNEYDDVKALIALVGSLGGRGVSVSTAPHISLARDHSDAEPEAIKRALAGVGGHEADAGLPGTDSSGLPWDDRIHSTPATTNADGTWRKRRGVSESVIEQVTAELRGVPSGGTAPQPEPEAPAAPPPPATPEPAAPPPAPEPVAPAAPAAGARFNSFADLVQYMSAKGQTYEKLNAVARDCGVDKFPALKDHPDKWEMFADMAEAA